MLDFLLYDVTQREINNNNGGPRVQLPTLPISKSIFFQQSGWRLVLGKGATFCLKPIIFWIYNTCYLVLFCEMMVKSMSLTMQELSKRSETLCQVWTFANRLYIEMQGLISIVASISQPYFQPKALKLSGKALASRARGPRFDLLAARKISVSQQAFSSVICRDNPR